MIPGFSPHAAPNHATSVKRPSKDEVLERFGRSLKAHRLQAGLSQEALAAMAGLDRTYVGGAERGERNVAVMNIYRLAVALDVRPSDLLSDLDSL
jgi:transcriptional regulator with XRE-family HTH domain